MVKFWVSHSELQKEEKCGGMNDQGKSYQVEMLRAGHL